MGELIFAIVIAGLILGFIMTRQAFGNKVNRETLEFSDFPKEVNELKIFFISDIHRRTIDDRIIHEVEGEADIVVIGGDLTEKGVPLSRVEKNLEKLSSIGPVYFIWGNNDYEVDAAKLNRLFEKHGVNVLKNEATPLKYSNHIMFIGLDFEEAPETSLRAILHSIRDSSFRVLLSHHPIVARNVTESDHISLILSGHTHGGQIRILGFGPYDKGGIKKLEATTLLVSNGYGTSLLPLRLGAPAETHLILLRRNKID